MPMDFPSSPTAGQSFTSGGTTWVWTVPPSAWKATSGPSGGASYLPITGGQLNPGGLLVGTAGTVPGTGVLTLNANTSPPPAAPVGEPNNLWLVGSDTATTNIGVMIDATAGSNGAGPVIGVRYARGTLAAPTAVQNNDPLFALHSYGYAPSSYGMGIQVLGQATETWTGSAHGTKLTFSTTPAGTAAFASSLTLAGNSATFSGNVAIPNDLGIGSNAIGAGSAQRLSVVGNAVAGQVCAAIATGPAGADTTSFLLTFLDASAGLGFLGAVARNGTGSVAYQTSSDVRLKENLVESEIGLDAVMQLKVYDYTWKSTGEASHGLVAQEVQAVYPYAVREGGDDPLKEPWMIDHGRLTPLLISAIKELKAEIDSLKAQLAGA